MDAPRKRSLPVDGKTLAEAYIHRVENCAKETLFMTKQSGEYLPTAWGEVHASVLGIVDSLKKMGVGAGDKVCIMSNTRPEWVISDMAIMFIGAVTVPIYQSNSVEDIAFILEDCGAKLIIAEEPGHCQKVAEAFAKTGRKIPLVLIQTGSVDVAGTPTVAFSTFSATVADQAAAHAALKKTAFELRPEAMASIVYTSGTTGRPKGVVLLHSNLIAELRSIVTEIKLSSDDKMLTFLPFAHIFGRVESLAPIMSGIVLCFAENINTVAQNIAEAKPTILMSVPRIYEKIYTKIQSDVESQPEMKRNIFKWAVKVGREMARCRSARTGPSLVLAAKYQIADRLVFSKIRAKMGGNLRFTVSGGAPLSPELCEFFHGCGIKILEGYGLTETTAAITVNRPEDYVFGSVGKPFGPTDIRIAEDGEIQVKSAMVFKEYFNHPEATREVFTPDGFFCTGDIGEFDSRGFLKITDRKKELIVTSGGKKVAPQKLENRLKGSRFISNGLVFGDKQKYLVTLICLNENEIKTWASGNGVHGDLEALSKNDKVMELIENEVKTVNSTLASYESIKKFRILPRDFTIEGGELTPSLKVKRKVCVDKFRDYIDSMYQ